MLPSRRQRLHHLSTPRRISQRDGEIAQPAFIPDAPNRAAFGAREKLFFAPREQLHQPRFVQRVTRREVALRRKARELVPRAHKLTIVTAVDAIADSLA